MVFESSAAAKSRLADQTGGGLMVVQRQARTAVSALEQLKESDLPRIMETAAASAFEFHGDLVTLVEGRAAEAEAIRTARTHVIARHLEEGKRGLAVCAPTAGAGCTFTAGNLAVALSQVGIATLLIDADLRKPGLEALIRPSGAVPGLRQYLTTPDRPQSDFIQSEVLPNLSVLFAGGATEQAQELLGGESFRDLIDRCLRDFEFTIIDTPPTNASADALRAVSVIGYALIVARTNVTMLKDLTDLAQQLQENGGRIVGAVLNEA